MEQVYNAADAARETRSAPGTFLGGEAPAYYWKQKAFQALEMARTCRHQRNTPMFFYHLERAAGYRRYAEGCAKALKERMEKK